MPEDQRGVLVDECPECHTEGAGEEPALRGQRRVVPLSRVRDVLTWRMAKEEKVQVLGEGGKVLFETELR